MSHFTVALIMDGTKTIDEMMAPYMEYSAHTPDEKYLEFYPAAEDEYYVGDYADGCCEYVIEPGDPVLRLKYDERYVNPEYDIVADFHGKGVAKYVYPDGSRFVNVPFKLIYPTFESYMEEWHEQTRDEKTGEFGYWQNPNAKWDWCSTWYENGWEHEVLGGPSIRIGDIKVDREGLARKAAEDFDRLNDDRTPAGFNFSFRSRGMSREQFVEAESHLSFRAVITNDGVWHEVGEMGWFGMSPESADEMYDWDIHFEERFIETADPDWYIVLVDCHI